MKLVIDLRLIHNSGIGTYIKNVAPSIIEGFDEVYALGDPQKIETFPWSDKIKIIPFRYKVYSLIEQLKYPLLIPACDVLWTPHFNAPLLFIRAKKRIVTIHDINHLSNPQYFSYPKRIWAKILYKNAVKRSDAIFTVSDFSKSEILRFFKVSPNKIQVVYCGVDQNFAEKTPSNADISLPPEYLLFVGNIKPHKNLITLLRAYDTLDIAIKEKYKLVILGRKEGFVTGDTEIFRYIENQNISSSIYFTGHIADDLVSYVYKNATLFIFPSLYEGFGLPILEAMSCAIPVLSSDRASLPEVGGDAVMYFNPQNIEELKEKITQLVNDESLRSKLIQEGKEQLKKFSWQDSVSNHLKVFEQLK